MKYQYTGERPVHIPQIGTFEPGEQYEVEEEINHPDFKEIKAKKKKSKK